MYNRLIISISLDRSSINAYCAAPVLLRTTQIINYSMMHEWLKCMPLLDSILDYGYSRLQTL